MSSKALYDFDIGIMHESGAAVLEGIDEAGRGPLAGPVVIAGVAFPNGPAPDIEVNDSKALGAARRYELAEQIRSLPGVRIAVAIRSAGDIDRLNILGATHDGMRDVARALAPDLALVDGLKVPRFPVPARFIVKGDATSASIAAASIIAKTTRDGMMDELDAMFPQYGFAKHKGYGTAEHLEALRLHGPCPEHRRTFAPVKALLGGGSVQLELPLG